VRTATLYRQRNERGPPKREFSNHREPGDQREIIAATTSSRERSLGRVRPIVATLEETGQHSLSDPAPALTRRERPLAAFPGLSATLGAQPR